MGTPQYGASTYYVSQPSSFNVIKTGNPIEESLAS